VTTTAPGVALAVAVTRSVWFDATIFNEKDWVVVDTVFVAEKVRVSVPAVAVGQR